MWVQQYHGHAGMIIYAKPTEKTNKLNAKLAERKKLRGGAATKELTEGSDLEQGVVKPEKG